MIKVRYKSIDRFSQSRSFKTLKGAQRFAQKWVGPTPELGTWYAVSGDGVGRITVEGCSLEDLFPKAATPKGDDEGYGLGYMQDRGAS